MILKNSIKQSEILEILAKIRGANADQITRALYKRNDFVKLTQSYELLNKLIEKKYVEYFNYKEEGKQKRLYYLSKKGLNLFQEYHRVREEKKGSGLFNDFGYFRHVLYKPKRQQIKHLLMTIDAMIDVYLIKKHSNLNIDFAHNLYCATKYVKPDFVIQFGDYKYFVEIDRMNERGKALNKKFEKYNFYFKQIDISKIKGIYFIVPTPKNYRANQFDPKQKIRYESVINAYFETCGNFKSKVDLCFATASEFFDVLNEDFKFNKQHNPSIIAYFKKQLSDDITVNNENIYFVYLENKVTNIVTEINYRHTKIWFDLLAIQKLYSHQYESGNILIVNYKHVPDITIFTTKTDLKDIIPREEYPVLFTPTKQVEKIPKIEWLNLE